MSQPQYVFDQVQIGKGLRPLAQHGTITVDGGTLSLFDTNGQVIDSAPLAAVSGSMVRFTRGQTVSLTLNGTKYNASPGWGNHVGTEVQVGATKEVKTAAALLLQLVENAAGPA